MLFESGYSIHEQYEAMLFHYHYIVPRLGDAPGPNGKPKWKSPLSMDGSPAEYSFKWNTRSDNEPDVRYTIECLGDYTGSAADPYNIESTKDLMYQLSLKFPSIDLAWFHQLVAYVYDIEKANYLQNGGTPTTTMVLAFELLKTDFMVKAYFVAPQRLEGTRVYDVDFWATAVSTLAPASVASERVFSFLSTNFHGQALHPAGLAIDCVVPSKSRVKFYLQNADTSFDSVRAIMTMGGTLPGLDAQLDDLYELIKIITGLPEDHPSSSQVPATTASYEDGLKHFDNIQELLSGYVYYFDIKPGADVPDIKFYIPTRHYARSDSQVAQGLATWMRERGRGQYVDNYMRILDSICTHRPLQEGNGLHAFVSCAFTKGELSITSYVGPEAYHPRRLGKGTYSKQDAMDFI